MKHVFNKSKSNESDLERKDGLKEIDIIENIISKFTIENKILNLDILINKYNGNSPCQK